MRMRNTNNTLVSQWTQSLLVYTPRRSSGSPEVCEPHSKDFHIPLYKTIHLFKKIYFLNDVFCVNLCMWLQVPMEAGGAGSPELELQPTVSHRTLVLGDILGSFGRAAIAVNCWAVSPTVYLFICVNILIHFPLSLIN